MAYQEVTTSIGTPDAVINQIVLFAAAAGWTVERNNLVGSSRTATLRRSGIYIHLWNPDAVSVQIVGSTGYSAGAAPNAQPGGSPSIGRANIGVGPYAKLFLFAGTSPTEHVHIQIERQTGLCRMVSFGELEKVDAFTGGTFYDATCWTETGSAVSRGAWTNSSHPCFASGAPIVNNFGAVHAPADGKTWARFNSSDSTSNRAWTGLNNGTGDTASGEGALTALFNLDINAMDNRRVGHPIRVDVSRPAVWTPLGVLPGVRYIRMDVFDFGQEVTDVDSLVWKIFPMVRKGSSPTGAAEDYSGWNGYAILKTP